VPEFICRLGSYIRGRGWGGIGPRDVFGPDPGEETVDAHVDDHRRQQVPAWTDQSRPHPAQVVAENRSGPDSQPHERRPEAMLQVDELPKKAANHFDDRGRWIGFLPALWAVIARKLVPAVQALGGFCYGLGGVLS